MARTVKYQSLGFKYQSPGGTMYGYGAVCRMYAKKFNELNKDQAAFEKWLFTEKGFRLFYL